MISKGEFQYVINKVEKFPVETRLGTYKVSIRSKYVALGEYVLDCVVYKKRDKHKLFCGEFKKVYRHETSWRDYNKRLENLVELAKESVLEYEETIMEDNRHLNAIQDSLVDFEQWDGKIREEAQ